MEFNATFIVVLLSFIGFMVAMRQIFFEPIRHIKAAREAEIGHCTAEATQMAQELAQLEASQREELAKARQQAQQMMGAARAEALVNSQQQLEAAKQQAQQQLEAHAVALAAQADALKAELADERLHFAQAIVAELTQSTPNGQRQPALSQA